MTLAEAILAADLTRPNELEPELKRAWLSALDGQLDAELYAAHEDRPAPFAGYDGTADPETTVLLVPWPYDDIYIRYLVMRIDLENGELERYNNDALAFNRILRSYAGHYARNHMPVGERALRF